MASQFEPMFEAYQKLFKLAEQERATPSNEPCSRELHLVATKLEEAWLWLRRADEIFDDYMTMNDREPDNAEQSSIPTES